MITSSHSRLIPFVLVVFSLLSPSWSDPYSLINQICNQTADIGYCIGILRNNQTSPATDLKTLIRLTVDKAQSVAVENEIFIQDEIKAHAGDPMKQLYEGCDSNYQQVLGFIVSAKDDCDRQDYSRILELFQQCIRPVINCQSAISQYSPTMLENNRLMRVVISMGFYEGKLL